MKQKSEVRTREGGGWGIHSSYGFTEVTIFQSYYYSLGRFLGLFVVRHTFSPLIHGIC